MIDGEAVVCENDRCCSADGYCGTEDDFCFSNKDKGCQAEYGICKCGEKANEGICSSDYCCSADGYCGTTNDFCSVDNGCQTYYGRCLTKTDTKSTCSEVKKELSMEDEDKDHFQCEEGEDGLAKTL